MKENVIHFLTPYAKCGFNIEYRWEDNNVRTSFFSRLKWEEIEGMCITLLATFSYTNY